MDYKVHSDLFGVIEMFKNWTVAKAAQLGKFMRNHWILHFKQVHFIPNKAVKTQTNPKQRGLTLAIMALPPLLAGLHLQ